MIRQVKLSDLANIRFGVNAKAENNADIPLLQGKDFDEQGRLDRTNLYKVNQSGVRPLDYLQPGEVLFTAKGSRNYAVVWDGAIKKAVASSTFFRLQPKNGAVHPEYLAWLLNAPNMRGYFRQHARATTILSLNKRTVENVDIPLPSLHVQQKVVQVSECWKKEKSLLNQWVQKKDQYINAILQKHINH